MKRRWTIRALTALVVVALMSVVLAVPSPALAQGGTKIHGIGYPDVDGDCEVGGEWDFATVMTGDLDGCLKVHVETAQCSPSGWYVETGYELFEGTYSEVDGSFGTTYVFTAKFADCENLEGEIVGWCHHPIVAGSGTEGFEGVSGRIDFWDNVELIKFPYLGHLEW